MIKMILDWLITESQNNLQLQRELKNRISIPKGSVKERFD